MSCLACNHDARLIDAQAARNGAHLGLSGLLVEREAGIDFGRDTTGNDHKNFLAEFNKLFKMNNQRNR